MSSRILIVDDDSAMGMMLKANLAKRGYEAVVATTAQAAFDLLRTQDFDVVVSDLNMPGMNGLELCERVAADRPDIPVVVITAFGSLETAIGAIRVGAYDFVPKPFEIAALDVALRRAIQHRTLRQEVVRLRNQIPATLEFGDLRGTSKPMLELYDFLERISDSSSSILITGESGTGKELAARAVHRRSRRSAGPFVAINCSAMPENLLESELFGYTRGAFTDAKNARAGLFLDANGGTLFLDEIGDLPQSLQPKLLRALQERKVRPIGGRDELPFDARILAATNRDLEAAVRAREFREDLYYRIQVLSIHLPPLRDRGNDVLVLAQAFLERFARAAEKPVTRLSPAVAARLLGYAWPGNVRELQNCIERAIAVARYDEVVVEDLPERVRSYEHPAVVVPEGDAGELPPMEEVERRYIERVLAATGGNRSVAAKILGLDRSTLYRRLVRYGAETSETSEDSNDPTGALPAP
ncbi:MAG: sigma-54-dependent Fis family transcriptional regulator [Deltaproteobacteria bacterium]|nr:sigma-54-dependent Fis family transcriptional regulator [Deltaproteobacteria bacterium]